MAARARSVLVAIGLTVLSGLTVPAVAAATVPASPARPATLPASPATEPASRATVPVLPAALPVSPAAVVCDATVALGSTSECDLAAGDSARYTVTVPSPDTLRYRVAVPSGQASRTMTLLDDQGTTVCADTGFGVAECAVPASNYVLEVTVGLSEAEPVFTSIDGVLAASCAPPPDLAVGATGTAFDLAAPGGSACAELDADAGDVLSLTLDSAGDQGLDVRVYDDQGTLRCRAAQVTAFARSTCIPSSGSGFRLFVSSIDEFAQTAVLIAARLSDPSGCATGPLDPFGVAATRTPELAAHQATCFDLGTATAVGVSAHASGTSVATVTWAVYDATGQLTCNGVHADGLHPLTSCLLNDSASHALIVSTLSRTPVDLVVSLVDTSAGAGCSALASTAWDASRTRGRLPVGAVDCRTFTASDGDVVRAAVSEIDFNADGLLVDSDGKTACAFFVGNECTVHRDGTYRALVSAPVQEQVSYDLWVINTSSSAGCTPLTPDPFGAPPTRDAQFTEDNLTVCYTLRAPLDSAYYLQAVTISGSLILVDAQLRSVDASEVCVQRVCQIDAAGTRLLVVSRSVNADTERVGVVRAGVYRLDRIGSRASCPFVPTTFDAPAVAGAISVFGEVDCHRFQAAEGDVIAFRATRQRFFEPVRHEIYDADGRYLCVAADTTCRLTGPAPYRLISIANYPGTSKYRFTVASLTAPGSGCRDLASLPFGDGPRRSFVLDDRASMRCFRGERAGESSYLAVRAVTGAKGLRLRVNVLDPNLANGCLTDDELGMCFGRAAGMYTFLLLADRPVSARFGWYDLAQSEGCAAGPDLSFGAPATQVRINQPGAVLCSTVPAAPGDQLEFSFGRTPAGTFVHTGVFLGNGSRRCGPLDSTDPFPAAVCRLSRRDTGPFRMLTWASPAATAIGLVGLHAWRLNDPVGCTDVGSFDDGVGPLVGRLTDPGEVDCYRGTTDGGTLSLTTSNDDAGDVPRVVLAKPNGALTCAVVGSGSCPVSRNTYSILVGRNAGPPVFTGHYRVVGEVH